MEPNQKDLNVEYFEVADPLAEEKKEDQKDTTGNDASMQPPASGQAYCEFKAEFDRETFEQLKKEADDKPKKNSADVLIFFADKSGSMCGAPL